MISRSYSNGNRKLTVGLMASALAVAFLLVCADIPAEAQTFNVIHTFTGEEDGGNPAFGLAVDRAGRVYGTANSGGTRGACESSSGCGTVYRMTPHGSAWLFNPLYSFGDNGNGVSSGITIAADGTLWGTDAVLYSLRPPARSPSSILTTWVYTEEYDFSYPGFYPYGKIAFDAAGDIYGTTEFGGIIDRCSGGLGCGTVYQLVKVNGAWSLNTLYKFMGYSDGGQPTGGVILDAAGNIYGTTSTSTNGAYYGSVFQISYTSSGWVDNNLGQYWPTTTGVYPMAGVIFDPQGNLYGVGSQWGANDGGTVVELSPSGSGWTFNPIYSFTAPQYTWGPYGGIAMDSTGNIYGTTRQEGAYNLGTVFKLTPSNGGWTYTDLHDFTGGSDGSTPLGDLMVDAEGNLWGTTVAGGQTGARCETYYSYQCGVIFEITPQ